MNADLSILEYSYYYALNDGNKSYTVAWEIELDENVKEDLLIAAIKETLKFFPRYAKKPVINEDGNIVLVDNNELPAVSKNEKCIYLGSKESNYYLFRVKLKDNIITFYIAHTLGDGASMTSFCENVLHYYYLFNGENPEKTKNIYCESDLVDGTYNMSLIDFVDKNYDLTASDEKNILDEILKNQKDSENKSFKLPLDDSLFNTKSYNLERIVINTKDFIELIHKYNATPISFVFILLAKSIINKFNLNDEIIKAGIAVDMRKYANSKSQFNFGTLSFMKYETNWNKLSLDEQVRATRNYLEKYLDIKHLMFICKFFANMQNNDINKYNIKNKDILLNGLKDGYEATSGGIFISNIGAKKYSQVLEKHIKNFRIINVPTKNDYEIDLCTYSDNFEISLAINGNDNGIFNNINNSFNDIGVKTEYYSAVLCEGDHIDPMLFNRNIN